MTDAERKPLPPYLPYKSFISFLDHLRAIGVPSHIDKSVMTHMSGGMQSWLKAGLRYMKLINADDVPDARLAKLANAQGEERKTLLRELFKTSYGFLDGEVDLKNTTPQKLRAAITDLGAQGETIEKIIAFMVAMGKDANVPMTTLITKRAPMVRRPRAKPTTRPPHQPPSSDDDDDDGGDDDGRGEAMKTITLPNSGGTITLSGSFNMFDLAGDERDLVFAIIDKMKAFEAAHPPEQEEEG